MMTSTMIFFIFDNINNDLVTVFVFSFVSINDIIVLADADLFLVSLFQHKSLFKHQIRFKHTCLLVGASEN